MARVQTLFTTLMVAVSLATASPSVCAQSAVGADVTLGNMYVWRGSLLASRMSVQPRGWINSGHFAAGTWSLVEPVVADQSQRTIRGRRRAFPSQIDVWGEVRVDLSGHSGNFGLTGAAFFGDRMGIPFDHSGTEWYATIEPRVGTPIVETLWYRLRYWHGTFGWTTRYAEAELGKQILLLPLLDITLTPLVLGGFNFSRSSPVPPFERIPDGRSVTHWQVGAKLAFSQRCDHSRWIWLPDLTVTRESPQSTATRRFEPSTTVSGFWIVEGNWWPRFCGTRR